MIQHRTWITSSALNSTTMSFGSIGKLQRLHFRNAGREAITTHSVSLCRSPQAHGCLRPGPSTFAVERSSEASHPDSGTIDRTHEPNRDRLFLLGGFHRVNSVRLRIQDDASFGGPISSSHTPKHSASNTNVSVTNAMSYSGLPRAIDRPQASQSLGAVL